MKVIQTEPKLLKYQSSVGLLALSIDTNAVVERLLECSDDVDINLSIVLLRTLQSLRE
ncbi:hypothetical protein [Paenibacillus sp. P46E]|uniref:hypothetical protein n=1 Tax=Paenibacillus sp. P46E TaxID=1349436 RepID=UPI000AC492E3|nr:hypothetical protein [Paenibacillus sp. P46E]